MVVRLPNQICYTGIRLLLSKAYYRTYKTLSSVTANTWYIDTLNNSKRHFMFILMHIITLYARVNESSSYVSMSLFIDLE